jgi:hypothetical protein
MNTRLLKTIMGSLVAAAMAFGTSGTVHAEADNHAHGCSVQTLRGLYVWSLDGYQNFGGNSVPKALLQGIEFHGNGTFTVPFGTVNIGGTIVIDVSGSGGTYTVAADCTGTLSVTDGPSFKMYIGPGAQQLWIIQTGGGPGDGTGLGVGTATRVPH